MHLGQHSKEEEPYAAGVASAAGGAAGEGQHSVVLGKGCVGQRASQASKETVDACSSQHSTIQGMHNWRTTVDARKASVGFLQRPAEAMMIPVNPSIANAECDLC